MLFRSAFALSGDFVFEQTVDGAGRSVVRVGAVDVSATLVAGVLSLDDGEGILVLSSSGVAADLAVTPTFTLPAGVTLAGTFRLAVNTTNAAVTESLVVGDRVVSLDLPAGPYLRVAATDVELVAGGQALRGEDRKSNV